MPIFLNLVRSTRTPLTVNPYHFRTMSGRRIVAVFTQEEVLRVKAACNMIVEDNFSSETHCDCHLLGPSWLLRVSMPCPLCHVACAFGIVTNGARINMWNTGLTPLSSTLLYVGDAQ